MFGRSSIYFSHLAMFHSPHDYQAILKVDMGSEARQIYLDDLENHPEVSYYTFVPKAMVLADVVSSKQTFRGALYRGAF